MTTQLEAAPAKRFTQFPMLELQIGPGVFRRDGNGRTAINAVCRGGTPPCTC